MGTVDEVPPVLDSQQRQLSPHPQRVWSSKGGSDPQPSLLAEAAHGHREMSCSGRGTCDPFLRLQRLQQLCPRILQSGGSCGPDNFTTADTRMTQHPFAPFFPCSSRACDPRYPKFSVRACHPCALGGSPGDTCGIKTATTQRHKQ